METSKKSLKKFIEFESKQYKDGIEKEVIVDEILSHEIATDEEFIKVKFNGREVVREEFGTTNLDIKEGTVLLNKFHYKKWNERTPAIKFDYKPQHITITLLELERIVSKIPRRKVERQNNSFGDVSVHYDEFIEPWQIMSSVKEYLKEKRKKENEEDN